MTGGFGVTCLRLVLVSSALTVHYSFSSFLVVARRHYRYKFAHNSWPHDVSKKTPHELLFGYNPTVDVTPSGVNNSPLATDRLLELQQARLHVLKH